MTTVLRTILDLLWPPRRIVRNFLAYQHDPRSAGAWKHPRGQAPAPTCLRRAMQGGTHLQVDPATEERCLSDLTKDEAEQLLDWIEGNGFQLRGVSFHEQTGFVVRWDVR